MTGLRIARVRGIDIRLHLSVVVIAWLVAWSLADRVLPESAPGYTRGEYWTVGVLLACLFFTSLVLHELGHSIVAIRRGISVTSITLWLLGGVATLGRRVDSATDALHVAGAGPAVSVALAVTCGTASVAATSLGAGDLIATGLAWLASMNLILALFNLLPAFPLDGGRIYQALRWSRTGNSAEATDAAARLGRFIGAAFIGLGILEAMTLSVLGGIWLVMIGAFLREAGRAEADGVTIDQALDRYTVRDVMTPSPVVVRSDEHIVDIIDHLVRDGSHASYPVVEASGAVCGLLSIKRIRALEPSDMLALRAADVATAVAEVPTAAPSDPARRLSEIVAGTGQTRVLVMDRGRLAGIVSPSDLARLFGAIELMTDAHRADSLAEARPSATHLPGAGYDR